MIQGRCPICGKHFTVASLDDSPSFPFCGDRCKLVDLGRWIDGDYAIPGATVKGATKNGAIPAEHADDDEDAE